MGKAKRESATISVTHINVRQSVAVVVIKLLLLELTAAVFVAFYFGFFTSMMNAIGSSSWFVKTVVLFFFALIKTYLVGYVIYDWINEYYEITPHRVVFRKGFIFKKKHGYSYNHIKLVGLKQGIWGRLFNFGTIHLYDRSINENIHMFLIHNPKKCLELLEELIPLADEELETVNIPGKEE
jgi:membrane protein YdbS with pleckstrin-like domain